MKITLTEYIVALIIAGISVAVANTYNFTVTVTDAAEATDDQALSIVINPSKYSTPFINILGVKFEGVRNN